MNPPIINFESKSERFFTKMGQKLIFKRLRLSRKGRLKDWKPSYLLSASSPIPNITLKQNLISRVLLAYTNKSRQPPPNSTPKSTKYSPVEFPKG
jgi:hypothetical protein